MSISRRSLIAATGLSSIASLLPRFAFAAYPDRPIRLIVPFAAGGNADLVGRLVAEGMAPSLNGQSVVVENRAGAGRLHAAGRLQRPADRQSVRSGQAQLRSAQGFCRRWARQSGAAYAGIA